MTVREAESTDDLTVHAKEVWQAEDRRRQQGKVQGKEQDRTRDKGGPER